MPKIILVVEDEIDICEIIVEILTEQSYQVVCVSNGQEAVEVLNRITPDLILSDIMMPKMDGYQLHEYIQKYSILSCIPFIFLTAKASRQDVRYGMSKGADDYLTKPFSATELISAVETRIKKNSDLYGRKSNRIM